MTSQQPYNPPHPKNLARLADQYAKTHQPGIEQIDRWIAGVDPAPSQAQLEELALAGAERRKLIRQWADEEGAAQKRLGVLMVQEGFTHTNALAKMLDIMPRVLHEALDDAGYHPQKGKTRAQVVAEQMAKRNAA